VGRRPELGLLLDVLDRQLMVLTRDTGDWRIRTISWSSNQP
jgi:hypothetical protein